MKAYFYGLLHSQSEGWSWEVSLHPGTDQKNWSELYGASCRIVEIRPFLSFGQAMELREYLRTQGAFTDLDWVIGVAQEFVSVRFAGSLKLEARDVGSIVGKGDEPVYGQWGVLQGKALLFEEVQALLASRGWSWNKEQILAWLQQGYLKGALRYSHGVVGRWEQRGWLRRKRWTYRCNRCGNGQLYWADCPSCGKECPYCEACLTMGRSRYCGVLILGGEEARSGKFAETALERHLEPWGLSDAQATASLDGLRFLARDSSVQSNNRFLIWAVTGAGKTEMIFPLVDYILARQGRVLIATPRKDVVLELDPRLRRAFPCASVVTLYGGSAQKWEQGSITLATTHQLLRFQEAFDLVIIDEIDAFPYHNNPMLEYAASKACKSSGSYILLSATPPSKLKKAANSGKLLNTRVPVRYHRNPLPVPMQIDIPRLSKLIAVGVVPVNLRKRLSESIDRGAQIFVFVPRIKWVDPFVSLLGRLFPGIKIDGTSSKDEVRSEKVLKFRGGEIRILVTTTILERGVTVPKSDVFIIGAEDELFDEAALVQMAGRAGRSKDDPVGRVVFAGSERTRAQVQAVKEIKQMNKIAKKRGYLIQ